MFPSCDCVAPPLGRCSLRTLKEGLVLVFSSRSERNDVVTTSCEGLEGCGESTEPPSGDPSKTPRLVIDWSGGGFGLSIRRYVETVSTLLRAWLGTSKKHRFTIALFSLIGSENKDLAIHTIIARCSYNLLGA